MFNVLIYRRTFNLGDAIQTVALSRMLGANLAGVYRDAAHKAQADVPFVVNGWIGEATAGSNALFAGVHVGRNAAAMTAWMGRSAFPVGCRDPHTKSLVAAAGVAADMVGCASLTFEPYRGPRYGRYVIDVPPTAESATATALTNYIPGGLTWPAQWRAALDRLELLRRVEVVFTTRLHVVLPCLAFGTPVVVPGAEVGNTLQPERLSLLTTLGLPFDQPVTLDVMAHANRFTRFLGAALGRDVRIGEPVFPSGPVERR